MKKKGFTLIELLAVIIILAVIALIATPVVLNVVENARKEAAENSAYGIIDAAKYAYTDSLLTGEVVTTGNVANLKVSGTPAISGTWNLDTSTGKVTLVNVVIGDYTCNGSNDSVGVTCTKGSTGGEDEPQVIAYYAFGLPTTSSSTDYQSVITESGSNTFTKLEGDQLSVCIYRNNALECFKNNNHDEEIIRMQNLFGVDGCEINESYLICRDSDFRCDAAPNGDVSCLDYASWYSCNVYVDGRVNCSEA